MDTATFLAQHTAPLRDWPAEDVFACFATGPEMQDVLSALPPTHKFRKLTGHVLLKALEKLSQGQLTPEELVKRLQLPLSNEDMFVALLEFEVCLEKLKERGTCCCLVAGVVTTHCRRLLLLLLASVSLSLSLLNS